MPIESSSALTSIFGKRFKVNYPTYTIYFDESVEEELVEMITEDILEVKLGRNNRFKIVTDQSKADATIKYARGDNIVYATYLLPVGHLYWLEDSISLEDIYSGEYDVVMKSSTYSKYSQFVSDLNVIQDSDVLGKVVEGSVVALVEPKDLTKEMKLQFVDEKYYLDTFDTGFPISLIVESDLDDINVISNAIYSNVDIGQRGFEVEKVTKLNMTGVTALSRRVASVIDSNNDNAHPARLIGEFLSDADLTHTSNEVSFVEGCNQYTGTRFCSKPGYIETLKYSGINIVELTGNHNNDYGHLNNTKSIEMYKELGWKYFGGGLNDEDASTPLIIDINDSKIGFIGYNPYDSMLNSSALARANTAGANFYSDSKMKEDIAQLKNDVDVVIITFQFQECYSYPSSDVIFPVCYRPIANQKETFRKAVEYGADIVIGTQAHQPQTYEVYKDSVIYYGLGNLYFDQTPWIGTRQGMVLTHYIYDGEHIQTKITPTIYDSSLQTHIADEKDANLLLKLLKDARAYL